MEARRKTAVVVEDQPDIRELERVILEGMGFQVLVRETADGLVDVVRRQRPDLIVLDLFLPGKSGSEVLADLARDPIARQVPVVVVSAYPEELHGLPLAARVVVKPFDIEEFETAVRGVVGQDDN
ncbi:MAG TPA: response regulator [Chloroflexota bacterium]|jgi:DNA-binding response OmpR family regulator